MKKIALFLSLFLAIGITAMAQEKKEAPKSPRVKSESANVSVSYGQPSKRGREIFGKLVPYGEIWRTGANEATEITFKKDVNFGGRDVKAGTYTLFTKPYQEQWVVILNSTLGEWGAFNYEKIKDKNVTELKTQVTTSKPVTEKLTMTATDKSLTIAWDQVSIVVPIEVK